MVLGRVLRPLFDQRCVGCGVENSGAAGGVCAACLRNLRPPLPIPPIAGLASCQAIFDYEGVGRAMVRALKFDNRRAAVAEMGRALAASLPPDTALVTWAPTTAARRRHRGYDQAHMLAVAVGRSARLPVIPTLARAAGAAQTGRSRAERRQGPRFIVRERAIGGLPELGSAPIVIVDDVITTGSTLRNAGRVLSTALAAPLHGRAIAYRAAR
ncbi:MAG: ComF family protein [Acidimicrobiales bacterium]|nr:ComF family protein [Acidimicrobiales bacterium]